MATRTFANIAPYQQRANQPIVDPLTSILQGLQTGVDIVNLPARIQQQRAQQEQQALLGQIQVQLQQEKLKDVLDPNRALVREINNALTIKAVDPTSGIAFTSLPGETIAAPGGITQQQQDLLNLRTSASEQGGIPLELPTAPLGTPTTPIIGAGGRPTQFNFDPSVPRQAQEQKLADQISLANARLSRSGVQGQFIPDGYGGMIFAQKPATPGGQVVTTQVTTPTGADVKVAPKGVKNILALDDKTGRVTNIALAPGESLPEGFKQATKSTDFKDQQALRKEIAANEVVKQFTDVSKSKQRIDDAMAEAASTNNFVVVDQALISSFNRLLEPDSVTMVSEYARTSADAPLINRIRANITRITEGGRLSPEERDALSKLSNRIYQTSLSNYSRTVDWFEDIAQKSGFDPADVIQPLLNETRPSSGPVTLRTWEEGAALPKGTPYIGPDGKPYTRQGRR